MKRRTLEEFEALLLGPTRWIDVRAPVEFQAGAVPGALNLPLLTDEERHLVGTTYKEKGPEAAIQLGHQLVAGDIRETRIQSWMQAAQDPQAVLYCFRGGLRSRTVQAWLAERGIERPLIEGGYKALRRYFLKVFESQLSAMEFQMIGGPTGSGKTAYLWKSGQAFLDLEFLARHRGSAFGAWDEPQPSQADFENALALALLKLSTRKGKILVECESRLIGKRYLPDAVFRKMQVSPRIEIEKSLDERVENVFLDYIVNSSLGTKGDLKRFAEFRKSVTAISRKLGGARTQEVLQDLAFSQAEFEAGRGLDSNRVWIRKLLIWYYDPGYRHSLLRRE